ncbi:MAG TPA: DUF72 domain-containing protein [Thermoanaerobaculia bacterium]|nr:DUF72 domain-containing protein [Thermoanaerobaculia bacterium]
MPDVRIGPAGWSYKDWEGVVYPPHGSRFDPLGYLASFFDTIEINSPFYRIPPVTYARSWVRRVAFNPRFRFTTKVFRGFTHEQAALRGEDVKAFRDYLDPLQEGGRLGSVLLQFPWSFKDGEESRARLVAVFDALEGYPRALEVRHASFQHDDFFRFLEDHDVAWVNIDQPLFHDSVRPADTVTGPLAYVRLHGRNYEKWFTHEESWERYDYLYTPEELGPWVERVRKMAEKRDVYVITNNHFRGQAIVNACDLQVALGREAKLPPQLREVYGDRVRM